MIGLQRESAWRITPLQRHLVTIAVAHVSVTTLVFCVALVLPLALDFADPTLTIQSRTSLSEQLLAVNRRLWPALLLVLALALVQATLVTRQITTPLTAFRRVFRSLQAGKVPAANALELDTLLRTESAALRDMVASLERRSIDRAEEIHRMRDDLAALEKSLEPHNVPAAANNNLRQLHLRLERIAAKERPQGGFSLLELIIVVGLIGTLASIGVPQYMEALEKARVAKAIGDIDAMALEIELVLTGTGEPPASLAEIGFGDYLDPYGRPYVYVGIRTNKSANKVGARKDKFLKPLNSDFDLFSMGADGEWAADVGKAKSKDDIIRAANGGFIGLADDY